MMNNQVKIYEVTCYQSFMMSEQGTGFSLTPWGRDTMEYKGYDDNGTLYILPDGYKVADLVNGGKGIFDMNDKYRELINSDNIPAILLDYDILKLEKVGA